MTCAGWADVVLACTLLAYLECIPWEQAICPAYPDSTTIKFTTEVPVPYVQHYAVWAVLGLLNRRFKVLASFSCIV